jgi:DNA-binding IclR family transcriptional regulator
MSEVGAYVARSGVARNQLAKAFRILAVMAESGATDLGVREIASMAPMAPSTVHRLLGDLSELGVVSAEPGSRYTLGLEIRRLAGLASAESWPEAVARQRLARLHDKTRGMVVTTHYDSSRRQVTHSAAVGGPLPVRFLMPANRWLPDDVGAAALAIRAFQPGVDEEPQGAGCEALSPGPSAVLSDQLEQIRADGYAISRGPTVYGAVVVAAPIPGAGAAPRASLAVVRPVPEHDERDLPELVDALRATADAVAGDLAAHGGPVRLI